VATATVAGGLKITPGITPLGNAKAGDRLTALLQTADTAAGHRALVGYTEVTAATTHTNTGSTGYVVANHGAGTVAGMVGAEGNAQLTGAGTVTLAVGLSGTLNHTGAGTITAAACARVNDPAGSGTITTLYGLYVEPMTRG